MEETTAMPQEGDGSRTRVVVEVKLGRLSEKKPAWWWWVGLAGVCGEAPGRFLGLCGQACAFRVGLRFLLHRPPDPVIIASLILSVGQRAYLLCSLLFSQNLMHCSPSVNPC